MKGKDNDEGMGSIESPFHDPVSRPDIVYPDNNSSLPVELDITKQVTEELQIVPPSPPRYGNEPVPGGSIPEIRQPDEMPEKAPNDEQNRPSDWHVPGSDTESYIEKLEREIREKHDIPDKGNVR